MIQWFDADGRLQPLLDKPGLFVNPHFSPDGERLAVANDDWKSGIWIYDIRRDTLSPLTGERNGSHPVWTPDGKYVAYQAWGGISYARGWWEQARASDREQGVSISRRFLARWQVAGLLSRRSTGVRPLDRIRGARGRETESGETGVVPAHEFWQPGCELLPRRTLARVQLQ
jgi:dipeptidyl aminopeptidase/acylaminoacyl peptidase